MRTFEEALQVMREFFGFAVIGLVVAAGTNMCQIHWAQVTDAPGYARDVVFFGYSFAVILLTSAMMVLCNAVGIVLAQWLVIVKGLPSRANRWIYTTASLFGCVLPPFVVLPLLDYNELLVRQNAGIIITGFLAFSFCSGILYELREIAEDEMERLAAMQIKPVQSKYRTELD